jgi:hypothetical protein
LRLETIAASRWIGHWDGRGHAYSEAYRSTVDVKETDTIVVPGSHNR